MHIKYFSSSQIRDWHEHLKKRTGCLWLYQRRWFKQLSAEYLWNGDVQIQPPGPSTNSSSWTGQNKPSGSRPAGWWCTSPACRTPSTSWIPARRDTEEGLVRVGPCPPLPTDCSHADPPPPTCILLRDPLNLGAQCWGCRAKIQALKHSYIGLSSVITNCVALK